MMQMETGFSFFFQELVYMRIRFRLFFAKHSDFQKE